MKAAVGIEPTNKGFADLCLTTWLRRRKAGMKDEGGRMKGSVFILHPSAFILNGSGRRDLNPRLRPWQGRTLPLSYSRTGVFIFQRTPRPCQATAPPGDGVSGSQLS